MAKFSHIKSASEPWTNKELAQATRALSAWFTSQDLAPEDAIPVMVIGIVLALASVAATDEARTEGAAIVYSMLIDTIKVGVS